MYFSKLSSIKNHLNMKKNLIDTKKLAEAATRLRAVSHPMRIAIVALLDENKKMNVTQIHTRLNLEQATTSHHLSLLKKSGIVSFKKNGKECVYFLKENALNSLAECIRSCSQ